MSHIFIKKNKSKIILIIFLFMALNLVNYIYQSNYIKKIYRLNLNLKNNIVFDFVDINDFNKNEDVSEIAYTRDFLERYERVLELRMEEKIYYEINYNQNLVEISNNCVKSKIKIEGRYYFINCTTTDPIKSTKIIIDNLSIVLTKTLNDMELLLTKKSLSNLGIKQEETGNKKFDVIASNVVFTNNIIKNILYTNAIFIFIIILYFSYIKKFKKIFFR